MKKFTPIIVTLGVTMSSFFVGFIGIRHVLTGQQYSSAYADTTLVSSADAPQEAASSVQLFDVTAVKLDALSALNPQDACGCPGCCSVAKL